MELPKLKYNPNDKWEIILPRHTFSPKLFADGSGIVVVYDSEGNQLNYTKSNPGRDIKPYKKEN